MHGALIAGVNVQFQVLSGEPDGWRGERAIGRSGIGGDEAVEPEDGAADTA